MGMNWMQMFGRMIHNCGYHVIPIRPGTKKPGNYFDGTGVGWTEMTRWSEFCKAKPTDGLVERWSSYPDCGIGIACGNVVAIDVDVLDADVADNVEVVIREKLGNTPLKRVGKAPKFLLVYKTTAPFPKQRRGPIEALCDGQQFVAYSIHPDTGTEYTWPDDNPFGVPLGLLPAVTADQVADALEAAHAILPPELQAQKRLELVQDATGEPGEHTSRLGLTAHQDAILSALEYLQNPDLHWDEWNRVGMALYAASSGAEWASVAFHKFSERSAKYDAETTYDRWRSYSRSRPTSIGAGTLFTLAEKDGWLPPPDLDFHRGVIDTSGIAESLSQPSRLPELTVVEGSVEPEPEVETPPPGRDFTLPDGKFPYEKWFADNRSPVAQVANWILSTAQRPHPELALANTLAMFGALFGRNYRMARFGTRTNLMLVGVAPTGSGKEHSRSRIKILMEAAGLSKVMGGDNLASGAAVESMLREHPTRLNMIDEMGHFLRGIIDEKAPQHWRDMGKRMLEIYSASSSIYKGTQYADVKARPMVDIVNPIWCIYGTTTMETLRPALQNRMQQDGTLPRVIFFEANKRPEQNFDIDNTEPPPMALLKYLEATRQHNPELAGTTLVNISDVGPTVTKVEWSDEAFEMFKSMSRWQDMMIDTRGVVWTRLMENATKLAMIDAISRDPYTPLVRTTSMQKGFDLMYWSTLFLENMIRNESAENETEAVTKRVLSVIKNTGQSGISGGDLARATQYLNRKSRQDVIETLKESGQVREERTPPKGGGGGRPAQRYFAA